MSKKLIIVLDNDQNNLLILTSVLEKQGYQIISATRVSELEKRIFNEQPNLILLEAMLPGITGYGACYMLKEQFKNCPIIMISAHSQRADIERGFWCGADEYFTKPLDLDVLIPKIEEFLANGI